MSLSCGERILTHFLSTKRRKTHSYGKEMNPDLHPGTYVMFFLFTEYIPRDITQNAYATIHA